MFEAIPQKKKTFSGKATASLNTTVPVSLLFILVYQGSMLSENPENMHVGMMLPLPY